MSKSLMQYTSYIIMLSMFIDQGDGRWKERDKENIREDIMAYKKMAEKLEREIESFYEDYPEEWLKGDNTDIHHKYLSNLLRRNLEDTKGILNKHEGEHILSHFASENISNSAIDKSSPLVNTQVGIRHKYKSAWPKFEDFLLEIGRKYDWKNDRWIKVKLKPGNKSKTKAIRTQDDENSINSFNEKHKFSYKIVKLKSKSRRNVVVAVSAVR